MENSLIMFTKTFPYGEGETFIEQEIEIASRVYKEILLFCCQVPDLNMVARKVPKNVHVVAISKKSPINLIFKFLKYVVKKNNRIVWFDECKKVKGIRKKLFAAYFFAKSFAMYEECAKHLKKMTIGEEKFYILYSYWFFDITYAAIRLQWEFMADRKSKVVTRAHGYDLYKERNSMGYFPFREKMLRKLDAVYACSVQGRNYLREEYPEFFSKIQTAYLGTKNSREVKSYCRKEEFHVVTCSYIVPVKRVKKVAEACVLLEKALPKLKWTCFGDGELKEELMRYCEENLIKTEVDFKGFCSNQEILEFYEKESVDVFVNTSSSEGLPVSIMEAMSYAIPCVATDVGGTSEIVVDNNTGYLLEENFEIEELCEKLKVIASMDIKELKEMRLRCRRLWETKFKAEKAYADFFDAINGGN